MAMIYKPVTLARTEALLAAERFPSDGHGHRWPWPLV